MASLHWRYIVAFTIGMIVAFGGGGATCYLTKDIWSTELVLLDVAKEFCPGFANIIELDGTFYLVQNFTGTYGKHKSECQDNGMALANGNDLEILFNDEEGLTQALGKITTDGTDTLLFWSKYGSLMTTFVHEGHQLSR